ncbi:MAG: FAD-dependent oxidoreductase, partial [Planctomycetia bacterium]|nr:FAD-dependent oxidoreductase [Planctomycetia bacterium]
TIAGGYLLPTETQVRPPRHLAALRASCLARGVDFIDGACVTGFEQAAGRVVAVRLKGPGNTPATLPADRICLAAGAWSESLLADLGVRVPTRPWRGQILLHRTSPGLLTQVVNLGAGYDYLIPREDGRLLVGSTIEDAGFVPATTPAAIERLERLLRRLLPDTPFGDPERTWAGLRPGSPDGLPTIGPLPDVDNGWLATGHFRAGLHLSTGTAVTMADLMSDCEPPLPTEAFSATRHRAGAVTLPPG